MSQSSQLSHFGLRAKKSFGQHFLQAPAILQTIAAASQAGPNCPVLEIGPGLGALTAVLLNNGGKVVAIEKDNALLPVLRQRFAAATCCLQLLQGDALTTNFAAFNIPTLVGNLPYNCASRILVYASQFAVVTRIVAMVQYEVGLRLCAAPNTKHYGLLSVLLQLRFQVAKLLVVPPGAFFPRPKVHSMVVVLQLRPDACSLQQAQKTGLAARKAFSCRRKTLATALALSCQVSKSVSRHWLLQAELDPQRRAETLTLAEFERLGAMIT